MKDAERAALTALRFNWAVSPDDVWQSPPFHVDGLHPGALQAMRSGVDEAAASSGGSPIGLVLEGQRGSGKTHLLGWLRQHVQATGGYFFLVSLLSAEQFWTSVLSSMLSGLARPVPGSETQLRVLMRRLSALVGAPRKVRRAVMGESKLTRDALDAFVEALARTDEYVVRTSHETLRALALSASGDSAHWDIAYGYFGCYEEENPGERAAWGIRRSPHTPERVVEELSRLLAMTGPTVMAVDQIDVLLAQSAIATDERHQADHEAMAWHQASILDSVATGLMSLRERTRRTLTVVAANPATWALVKTTAIATAADRFREAPHMSTIKSPELARDIIARRFTAYFGQLGFEPPYPTWPIRSEAFQDSASVTPRQLLQIVNAHVYDCLVSDTVVELARLDESPFGEPNAATTTRVATVDTEVLAKYDNRFEELKNGADVTTPLEPDAEDAIVPRLLEAGLTAWILEQGELGSLFSIDPLPGAKPDLHARLRLSLNEDTEDQVHWCFRAISDQHHGNAALNRLRRANAAAGLDKMVAKRKLFLLRNEPWSGTTTQREANAMAERGGRTTRLDHEDLRILTALRTMIDDDPIGMQPWLTARRPAAQLAVLQSCLADVESWVPANTQPDTQTFDHDDAVSADVVPDGAIGPAETRQTRASIPVGREHSTGRPVQLALEALRKHITVFAGSGSGKTVLIRRIVEECALQGVSSIVIDPNNDLARLGDAWPARPRQWNDEDAAKATDYLDHTDVVVWTPRRESGRPLSFQPLPDFSAGLDDPDEFAEAVEAAVAALAPQARLHGRAIKTHLGQAVLRRAVEYYGRRGGTSLPGLIDVLANLPEGIIELTDADKIGAGLAQALTATMVNDPLFGGSGTPVDPAVLLTPAPGKRARVSVISLIGLPSDEERQSFVNQLEMALFAWIKKHPAGNRPLLGLLVIDEAQIFAPSSAITACTQSTLALASQARKYGLGLIFATQAPKGLHNRIPGNAATQVYGRLNSPIQIAAAQDMAKAKNGDVSHIARLGTGEFYLAAEGLAPQKVHTPLCLSYHPSSPLTVEEVIARAVAATS